MFLFKVLYVNPVYALRFWSFSVTALIIAAMFLKGSSAADFLLGGATGVSIYLQALAWTRELK